MPNEEYRMKRNTRARVQRNSDLVRKGGGGRDCFVVKERESHPTHEEKKKRILKTLLL